MSPSGLTYGLLFFLLSLIPVKEVLGQIPLGSTHSPSTCPYSLPGLHSKRYLGLQQEPCWRRPREVILCLCSVLVRPPLGHWAQCWAPQHKRDLESTQRGP
uniref:Uncharacterized protein n=1 Tax=Anas zonorhyncha TaxID=75864 RepID=A0A8B9UH75_9AVES